MAVHFILSLTFILDTPTLRFFYNLGVDCFNSTCSGRKPYKDVNMETGVMLSSMENKNMSEATMIECNTNEDDFCFNFQNKLLTKNNFNESLIEETFGVHQLYNHCKTSIR